MSISYAEFMDTYQKLKESARQFHTVYFVAYQEALLKVHREHPKLQLEDLAYADINAIGFYDDEVYVSTENQNCQEESDYPYYLGYSIPPEALEWPHEKIREFAFQHVNDYVQKVLEKQKDRIKEDAEETEQKERAELQRLLKKYGNA